MADSAKIDKPEEEGSNFHFNSYGPHDFSEEDHRQAKKKEMKIFILFVLTIIGVFLTTFFCRHSLVWPIVICIVVAIYTEGSGLLEIPVREKFVSIYIVMMILCVVLIAGGNIARAHFGF